LESGKAYREKEKEFDKDSKNGNIKSSWQMKKNKAKDKESEGIIEKGEKSSKKDPPPISSFAVDDQSNNPLLSILLPFVKNGKSSSFLSSSSSSLTSGTNSAESSAFTSKSSQADNAKFSYKPNRPTSPIMSSGELSSVSFQNQSVPTSNFVYSSTLPVSGAQNIRERSPTNPWKTEHDGNGSTK
jgi:hypothetical protein